MWPRALRLQRALRRPVNVYLFSSLCGMRRAEEDPAPAPLPAPAPTPYSRHPPAFPRPAPGPEAGSLPGVAPAAQGAPRPAAPAPPPPAAASTSELNVSALLDASAPRESAEASDLIKNVGAQELLEVIRRTFELVNAYAAAVLAAATPQASAEPAGDAASSHPPGRSGGAVGAVVDSLRDVLPATPPAHAEYGRFARFMHIAFLPSSAASSLGSSIGSMGSMGSVGSRPAALVAGSLLASVGGLGNIGNISSVASLGRGAGQVAGRDAGPDAARGAAHGAGRPSGHGGPAGHGSLSASLGSPGSRAAAPEAPRPALLHFLFSACGRDLPRARGVACALAELQSRTTFISGFRDMCCREDAAYVFYCQAEARCKPCIRGKRLLVAPLCELLQQELLGGPAFAEPGAALLADVSEELCDQVRNASEIGNDYEPLIDIPVFLEICHQCFVRRGAELTRAWDAVCRRALPAGLPPELSSLPSRAAAAGLLRVGRGRTATSPLSPDPRAFSAPQASAGGSGARKPSGLATRAFQAGEESSAGAQAGGRTGGRAGEAPAGQTSSTFSQPSVQKAGNSRPESLGAASEAGASRGANATGGTRSGSGELPSAAAAGQDNQDSPSAEAELKLVELLPESRFAGSQREAASPSTLPSPATPSQRAAQTDPGRPAAPSARHPASASSPSAENTLSASYFSTEEYVSQSRRYFKEMSSIYPEGFNEKLMMTADAFVTFKAGLQIALPYFLHRLSLLGVRLASSGVEGEGNAGYEQHDGRDNRGRGIPRAGLSTTRPDAYQNARRALGEQLERAVSQLREDCPALQRIRAKGSELRMRDVIAFCQWLVEEHVALPWPGGLGGAV